MAYVSRTSSNRLNHGLSWSQQNTIRKTAYAVMAELIIPIVCAKGLRVHSSVMSPGDCARGTGPGCLCSAPTRVTFYGPQTCDVEVRMLFSKAASMLAYENFSKVVVTPATPICVRSSEFSTSVNNLSASAATSSSGIT
jgi:hypothetical protein